MTLGYQGHDRRARFAQRGDLRVIGRLGAGPAGRAERGELRVLEVQFGRGAAEELGVLRDRARPAALDEPDAQLVELAGDDELVGHGQVEPLLLRAVAQGGVVDVEAVVEHFGFSRVFFGLCGSFDQNKRPLAESREVCASAGRVVFPGAGAGALGADAPADNDAA